MPLTTLEWVMLLFGCNGSGKGGLGEQLKIGYGQMVVAQSKLFRIYSDLLPHSPEAHDFLHACDGGDYASDEATMNTFRYFLPSFLAGNRGLVCDGMCRTLPQLDEMLALAKKHKFKVKAAFIDLPEEVCRERILTVRKAKEGRSDDNPETVEKRFKLYHAHTLPAIQKAKGLLGGDFLRLPGDIEAADKAMLVAEHFGLQRHRPAGCC